MLSLPVEIIINEICGMDYVMSTNIKATCKLYNEKMPSLADMKIKLTDREYDYYRNIVCDNGFVEYSDNTWSCCDMYPDEITRLANTDLLFEHVIKSKISDVVMSAFINEKFSEDNAEIVSCPAYKKIIKYMLQELEYSFGYWTDEDNENQMGGDLDELYGENKPNALYYHKLQLLLNQIA